MTNHDGEMERGDVIEGVLRRVEDFYVFPRVAEEMGRMIRRRQRDGAYDGLALARLCDALTGHLQEIGHDLHLRVYYSPEGNALPDTGTATALTEEEFRQSATLHNFGFAKVECLPGNIGYLNLPDILYPPGWAGATAAAAMTLLAHTSALIIDVRQAKGGDPTMVALLCSYFFPEPVHLTDFYTRESDSPQQSWTLPYVPGALDADKPLYVLTSGQTFSGAEELAYDLQSLKRATIVGETTGGAANPGLRYPVTDHVAVFVPTGRPVNPITGTNWEGTGVVPDIAAPREDALKAAYRSALTRLLEKADPNSSKPLEMLLQEAREALTTL